MIPGWEARTICLTLPSDLRFLELAHGLSIRIPMAMGVPEECAETVGNAVLEAVSNAIRHGNREDPSLPVHLVFRTEGDWVMVTVTDQGEGFDPSCLPDPTDPQNVLRSSGRGFFLMRTLMDEVRVEVVPGVGTRVTLTKRFESEHP